MKRWICPDCGARSPQAGDCPSCGEGPCLDLEDRETEALLRERDRALGERRQRLVTALAVLGGIAGGGAAGFVAPRLLPIPFGGVIQALVAMVLAAAALRALLLALFPAPRRFAFLDEGVSASVRSDATAMRLAEVKKPVLVLVGLSALGLVIGGVVTYQKRAAAEAERARREAAGLAWANLWQCALGGHATGEEVPTRVRLIALGDPPEGWPGHCSDHATQLFDGLDDRTLGVELRQALRDRFGCDEACTVDEPAAQFVGLARPPELPELAPTVEAPPRLDAHLLTKGDFASYGGGDARVIARDVTPEGDARILLSSRSRGHAICTLRPTEGAIDCAALSLPVTESTLRLVAGGDEPVLLGRSRADTPEQSFLPDGRAITTYAGRAAGHALSRVDDRVYEIARVRDGEPEARKELKLAEGAVAPRLLDDHVIWIEPGDEPTLYARPLGGEDVVGDRVVIGPVAQVAAPRVCTAGDLTAVVVGAPGGAQSVAFHARGTWHRPVGLTPEAARVAAAPEDGSATGRAPKDRVPKDRAPSQRPDLARKEAMRQAQEFGMLGLLGGGADTGSGWGAGPPSGRRDLFGAKPAEPKEARREADAPPAAPLASARPHLPRQALVCGAGHATLTWRDERTDQIHQARCTPEGCAHEVVTLAVAPQSWWHATSIGDRTLVIWRGREGELRLRFAPLSDLPAASDVLVMDSATYGGPETVDLEIFARDGGAIFWFRGLGFHGLAIDGRGVPHALGG